MALPSLSFLFGVFVTLYLSTFLVFAIIRVTTGVSIQRLGLTSLRRIAYTPRDGIRVDIRGLGIQIHRPTFAQPTWVSLVVSELKVTADLPTLRLHDQQHSKDEPQLAKPLRGRKKTIWTGLTKVKERIKKLHSQVNWIRLFDFVAHKTTFTVNDIGTVQVGSVIVSLDTRRVTVDRTRIFKHNRSKDQAYTPAEWKIDVRSILFTPAAQEPIEILDHGQVNIHGLVKRDVEGLRDVALAVKLGRLYLPYDDFIQSFLMARSTAKHHAQTPSDDRGNGQVSDKSSSMDPQRDSLLTSVTDARAFISSMLRGIHEVSFAASFVGMSKRLDFVRPSGSAVYVNMAFKEFGLDLYRLDPLTPAHAMHFERDDVAHQVLVSAISISLGIEDGLDHPERLLYIPMTTATITTTLPYKILQYAAREEILDRNTNVLFANLVITSPSIDCDPHHLPLIMAVAEQRSRRARPDKQTPQTEERPKFIQQLLPKVVLRLSVHEPIVRVALPTTQPASKRKFDFDLLISAVSSISLDMDSSHAMIDDKMQYSLASALRITNHKLYYQNALRERHTLIITDQVELRAHLSSVPQVSVAVNANIHTFTLYLVRPEIFRGLQHVTKQIRSGVRADKLPASHDTKKPKSLRTLPRWLTSAKLDAKDFNLEIAALDEKLSQQPRGFALHLDELTAEYQINKSHSGHSRDGPRRTKEQAPVEKDASEVFAPPPSQRRLHDRTDGRRLAIHINGFDGFVIEADKMWEDDPFLQMPKAEVALTTGNDGYGPTLHLNSLVQSFKMQYSLFRHYCIGAAFAALQKTFTHPKQAQATDPSAPECSPGSAKLGSGEMSEMLVIDAKIHFVSVKASFPEDPRLLLHVQELVATKHRWTTSQVRAQIFRLSCDSPTVRSCWNRIIGIKNPRIDIRENRKKIGHGPAKAASVKSERSIDVVADAIRIGIPHGLIVHKIFSNIITTMKAAKQLHHRFVTNSDEYILAKVPEGPKHIPRVTVRSHVFLFEIEDAAFEWKLGVIFRAGLVEQKQRLAREQAFRLKERELDRLHRGRGRTPRVDAGSERRSHSADSTEEKDRMPRSRFRHSRSGTLRASSHPEKSTSDLRYNAEGKCSISSSAKISSEEARKRLDKYNSESWKKRIDRSLSQTQGAIAEMRSMLWGLDAMIELDEKILQMPKRPALMSILMSDLNITVDKPSFPLDKLPEFMHNVGKGLPKDTEFGLLVPLGLDFEIGEARVSLRDYPLPLLHIPSIKAGQAPRLCSWSLKTDFVVAEEFRDFESQRDLQVNIIPPHKLEPGKKSGGFAIDVRRTVSPVKTYSEIKVNINTARETRFTWGASYQPAIQDMTQVLEGFAKPQIDPSPRVGFWDKLRLNFHSRVSIDWKGGGDVHLMLKGTRDPYVVTGHGAGFVMVWRNDVRLNIWENQDPKEFMTVRSGDYILAIPDFAYHARASPTLITGQATSAKSFVSHKESQKFKKVIMKLSGKVKWHIGLVFERDLTDGQKSFDFIPHWEITLKNPKHVKSLKNESEYDAFDGFRSNHIHMSVGVSAPSDRDWSTGNAEPAANYNSVHLSPRFFTHFFAWWSMFSGIMSLPVHHGALWPNVQKSGKKFGRHIATVKYSLMLSPLFLSHVYKHKDAEEYTEEENQTTVTGLKVKLSSFVLDLHQRREEFNSEVKGSGKNVRTSGMKINQVLLDLVDADIRAISAMIMVPSIDTVSHASNAKLAEYEEARKNVDLSDFEIPDNDFGWIDVDDFVEVDWTLPIDSEPSVKILPLAGAPRFTYRRQTDHHNTISGDPHRTSRFGYEDSHHCVMKTYDDSRQVQIDIIQERLKRIREMREVLNRNMGDVELKGVRATDGRSEYQRELETLKEHSRVLDQKTNFLQRMIQDLEQRMANHDLRVIADPNEVDQDFGETSPHDTNITDEDAGTLDRDDDFAKLDSSALADQVSDFNNRFVIHNAKIKWNNSLRNIMLRYIHQNGQRRGFVYYTSRRAVKFILDIIEEQKSRGSISIITRDANESEPESPNSPDDDVDVQDRIDALLRDGKRFVDADDGSKGDTDQSTEVDNEANESVSQEFASMNAYHLRLVAPQIQLQSEKNLKSAVILTARGMRLKVMQIMDKERMSDDVSGLVQRRFSMDMDNLQFFVTDKDSFSMDHLHMYSGSRYGAPDGTFWPPWVPIEVTFDFTLPSLEFKRVVQRTSASLRYDKYNNLRLKYNDNVSSEKTAEPQPADETRMDHLWIEFPQLRAICDSGEYFTLYTIAVDLLMWSEPLEKVRNERLEKIMLAADFSDLRGAPEMIITLQERIRQLDEIKTHFHVHEQYLDRRGWRDRIALERDLAVCEDELFFIMKAITTSQRKTNERTDSSQPAGLLKWFVAAKEIVWHLTKEGDEPLAEFQLGNAMFERTDLSDGSNHNYMEIDKIRGLSLLPNAVYPEIVGPYKDIKHPTDDAMPMFRVKWHMLEAIAGIPIVDHFEINLHPLKVQLEYDAGKQLFSYIFPGKGHPDEQNPATSKSPFLVKHLPASQTEAEVEDASSEYNKRRLSAVRASLNQKAGSATGAGSLESRLTPTLTLPDADSRPTSATSGHRSKGLGLSMNDSRAARSVLSEFPKSKSRSPSASSRTTGGRGSTDTRSVNGHGREITRVNTGDSTTTKKTRFSLGSKGHRGSSASPSIRRRQSDDLSQMMNRASNYMTLAYAKLPSVVLCLSYKGRGNRNFEDVHDLVFRMPTIEYRNKTWSNLDLVEALKKDVIKALVHHTGTIISNKFSHRKPGAHQASRLRELASSSVVLSSASDLTNSPSHVLSRSATPGGDGPSSHGSDADSDRPPKTSASMYSHSITQSPNASTDALSSANGSHLNIGGSHHGRPRTAETGYKDGSSPSAQLRSSIHRHFSDLKERARHRGSISRDASVAHSSSNGHDTSSLSENTKNGDLPHGEMVQETPDVQVQPPTPLEETPPKRRDTIKRIIKRATARKDGEVEGSTETPGSP